MSSAALDWQVYTFAELSATQLYAIIKLRQDIFIVEQSCIYPDLDDLDQQSLHLCGWREGELLCYLRALPPGLDYRESALGRIVVSAAARGLQLGRELVRRGIRVNQQQWPGSGIRIGAQAHLEAFYQSLGFETASEVYDEDGIPHIKMTLMEPA